MSKTKFDYMQMQKEFYDLRQVDSTANDVVGYYEWHEKYPYELGLLHYEADASKPIFPDGTASKLALDFGCGPARMIRRLSPLFKRIDGADICEWILDEAQRLSPESRFYLTSGNNLGGAPSDTYDFIYSTQCLQHISSHTIRMEILRDIYRCLKPGGAMNLHFIFNDDKSHGGVGYLEDRYDYDGTNSEFDLQIYTKDIPIIEKDLESLFTECRIWKQATDVKNNISGFLYLYGKKHV